MLVCQCLNVCRLLDLIADMVLVFLWLYFTTTKFVVNCTKHVVAITACMCSSCKHSWPQPRLLQYRERERERERERRAMWHECVRCASQRRRQAGWLALATGLKTWYIELSTQDVISPQTTTTSCVSPYSSLLQCLRLCFVAGLSTP